MLNIQIPWPGWEVSGEIGRGGFGAVYEIKRNVLGVEEHAAMKQITIPQNKRQTIEEMQNEGYDQSGITRQFKSMLEEIAQEYHLMQQLKGHTNVVYCDDIQYIQHDDGMGWDIFIKMELLTPLTKILQEASAEQQVIRLGKDICSALILCKNQKIIHRDIKPQNLFISRTGDYKLGDFGIAKTAERTTGGTKIGTYKFMAPEVYKSQPYGSSVDIYSLGLVMYWLLNEYRAPFLPMPPEIPTGRQEEEARQQRFSGQPIPAPKHGSEALRDIVLKACAYNPVDRFSGPEEMLSALNRLTAAETAVPEPEIRTTSAEEDETQTVGLYEKREAPQPAACRTPAPERDAVPAPAAEPVEDPTTGEEATHGIVQNNPEPAPITPQPAENAESPEEKMEGKFTAVSGKAPTVIPAGSSGGLKKLVAVMTAIWMAVTLAMYPIWTMETHYYSYGFLDYLLVNYGVYTTVFIVVAALVGKKRGMSIKSVVAMLICALLVFVIDKIPLILFYEDIYSDIHISVPAAKILCMALAVVAVTMYYSRLNQDNAAPKAEKLGIYLPAVVSIVLFTAEYPCFFGATFWYEYVAGIQIVYLLAGVAALLLCLKGRRGTGRPIRGVIVIFCATFLIRLVMLCIALGVIYSELGFASWLIINTVILVVDTLTVLSPLRKNHREG